MEAIEKPISRLGHLVVASEAIMAGLPQIIDRFPNREFYKIPCWLFAPLVDDSSPFPPRRARGEIPNAFFVMSLKTYEDHQGSNPRLYLIYMSGKKVHSDFQ